MRSRLGLVSLLVFVGCECTSGESGDGGTRSDGETRRDAAIDASLLDAPPDAPALLDDAAIELDATMLDGGPLPLAAEVETLLDAFCANERMCANRARAFLDADFCHRHWFGERPTLWSAGIAAGRLVVGDAYAECLAALATTCADLLVLTCARPFDGVVAEGADCFVSGECAAGLECISEGSCPRTCRPPRATDELCGAQDSCGREAVCPVTFGDTWVDDTCDPLGRVGEPCTRFNGCVFGAWCNEGTCAAEVGVGSPCTPLTGAFSPECEAGLVCVPDASGVTRCKRTLDLVEGDPCAFVRGDPCPGDLACAGASTARVCAVGAALGEACSADAPCASSMRCVGGICTAVVGPGDPCGPDAACTSEHSCAPDGTCHPLPVAGEPCTATTGCTAFTTCAGAQCRYDGEPGDFCGSGADCRTECGDDYRCLPLRGEGALCRYLSVECGPGLECREDPDGRPRCQLPCRP